MPTLTPPSTYAVVGATAGHGANVHRGPGLGSIDATVPDGTIVQLTAGMADADGLAWRQVILPDGRVGWLADEYLIPYDTYQAP